MVLWPPANITYVGMEEIIREYNLFVEEAMDLVVNDLNVDLAQLDSKNEGIVDAINFLYAGESQYDGDL